MKKNILGKGFVRLLNISGPVRRPDQPYDADSIDPAKVARKSFNKAEEERPRTLDMKLVNYLMTHKHTTPIEFIEVWLEMKIPIFIARQLIRHRTCSVDEESARYVQLASDWYVPKLKDIGTQPKSVKQGRSMDTTIWNKLIGMLYIGALQASCWTSYKAYQLFISMGIPKELARSFLHLNHFTEWEWKQDLHNMLHLIRLRRGGHAQFEAREVADAIYEILCAQLPEFMKLWDQQEADAIKAKELLTEHKLKMKKGESYGTD